MYGRLHHPTTTSEIGIVSTAVAYLLGRTSKLQASFIEYRDGKWFDLATGNAINEKQPKNYQRTEIISIGNVQQYLADLLPKRKTRSTNQNTHSSRSNAVLILSNENSKIVFVDLAGNETIDGKENIKETCSINTALTQLNSILVCKAKRSQPTYRENDFTLFLMPYLIKNKAIVFFHVRKENVVKDLLKIHDIVGIKQKRKDNTSKIH